MNAKHTPGPWVAFIPKLEGTSDNDESGNSYWNIEPESFRDGKEYLQLSGWMSEENARLIAAAPELIDALRSMEIGANTVVACYTRNPVNFAAALSDLQEYAKQARAVIAKATGQ